MAGWAVLRKVGITGMEAVCYIFLLFVAWQCLASARDTHLDFRATIHQTDTDFALC